MSKYKIGVTEAGDAGIDLSWVNKLDKVDGAVVITKKPTDDFCQAVLDNADKLIVHATITGQGGTVLEPNVPTPYLAHQAICELVKNGFPQEKVVIRVDPIIPTPKAIQKAFRVMTSFMDVGFTRYRVSIIDMYPHARIRFANAGLPLPYGPGFSPSANQSHQVDRMLRDAKEYFEKNCGKDIRELRIECCAEPQLKEPIQCGCVSAYDLALLGLDPDDVDSAGYQRKNCLCYSGKTELLSAKERCPNGCLYCFWR